MCQWVRVWIANARRFRSACSGISRRYRHRVHNGVNDRFTTLVDRKVGLGVLRGGGLQGATVGPKSVL